MSALEAVGLVITAVLICIALYALTWLVAAFTLPVPA